MVFDKLKQAGLTVKPSKCQFARPQCVYLGHIVGNGGGKTTDRQSGSHT